MDLSILYNEKELLLRAAEGDQKAFRSLYDAYFNRVSAYVFKLTKSDIATEEIVQDVFTRLWQHAATVAVSDTPEAYLLTIARNKTVDYLRLLAREANLINVLTGQIQQPGYTANDRLTAIDLQALIRQALQELSVQKQTIFHLSKNEGLSHDEIARRLNISKSTVKNHLSETLQHLRAHILNRYGHDAGLFILLFLIKSY